MSFADLGLIKPLLSAVAGLGYETPSAIQEKSIPVLLEGKDLIAQAQTGTGKTAAFALPILQRLDLKQKNPQALVLTPTRELAIQVAESFHSYAKYLTGFHVLPIYGGQDYEQQLRALQRGVHVVVGTPGRVMDHIRRGTLSLKQLTILVLDEADEMLNMGFLEDVEWVLEQIPQKHQGALFSATIPQSIRKISTRYLSDPVSIKIESKSVTASGIEQMAMLVSQHNKLEAITRYLEIENFEAILIFTRTKNATTELAEKLAARGYMVAALNGDMSQSAREKVIERIKNKKIDIVVATDVAARGLDVERLSHVINYDAPCDYETYTHRIGRTGRAGREGKSIILITPRERHFLSNLEQATSSKLQLIDPPSIEALRDSRIENFVNIVVGTLKQGKLDYCRDLVEKIAHQSESTELDVAAALLKIAQKDKPLQLNPEAHTSLKEERQSVSRKSGPPNRPNSTRPGATGFARKRSHSPVVGRKNNRGARKK